MKMYRGFYGLSQSVNRKDIAVNEFFLSANFKEALSRLEYMKVNRGFALVSGSCGVGKTTVLRYFAESLNPKLFKVVYIPLATVSVTGFYRHIGSLLCGEVPYGKDQLFQTIQQTILNLAVNQKTIPVLIFDDAHFFRSDNFFELQFLSNFNFDSLSPALFILIAQPHLKERLKKSFFDSFYQRIKMHIPVQPFSLEETRTFISHILSAASSSMELFSDKAVELIFDSSAGVARRIMTIMEKALIHGALNKKRLIDEEVIYGINSEL
jgi:general secretion pathway protein A